MTKTEAYADFGAQCLGLAEGVATNVPDDIIAQQLAMYASELKTKLAAINAERAA